VTQECDLDWDYKARHGNGTDRKLVRSILFCVVDEAQVLRGAHQLNSTLWNTVRGNNNQRYHVLPGVPAACDALGQGLPELAVDFKQYFTIPTGEVYARLYGQEARPRCHLISPYLENFSQRFHAYHMRVALPGDND